MFIAQSECINRILKEKMSFRGGAMLNFTISDRKFTPEMVRYM